MLRSKFLQCLIVYITLIFTSGTTSYALEAQSKSSVSKEGVMSNFKLVCEQGSKVVGDVDSWSPWSVCPKDFSVMGIGRLDLKGNHKNPLNHVNDVQCDERGCRAWCYGNSCLVQARCCKITFQ